MSQRGFDAYSYLHHTSTANPDARSLFNIFAILFHTDINLKIKQASGFAEVVFHIVTAFFETPLGHRLLYEGIQAASYTNNKLGTRNHEL